MQKLEDLQKLKIPVTPPARQIGPTTVNETTGSKIVHGAAHGTMVFSGAAVTAMTGGRAAPAVGRVMQAATEATVVGAAAQ